MSQASQAVFQGISLLLTQHRVAEARAELERLLALDPEDPEARSQAADVYAYTGAQAEAYRHYHWAAEAYNRLGRADMALAVHHKMLELDPSALDSSTQTRLRLLGLLVAAEDAILAGRHDRAVSAYQEAIRLFPNHTISYQRLASLLVRLNRVDEAAGQYLTVARAFYDHGVRGKARPYFERVLELQPWRAEALDALLACLRAEGKEAEGARHIRAGVQALLQSGQADAARALFARFGGAAALSQAPPPSPAVGTPGVEPTGAASAPGSGMAPPGVKAAPVSAVEQAAWRTLGEVCLAEGLFEEARWIFGRLLAARPTYPVYAEFLRRAEAGPMAEPQVPSAVPSFPFPQAPAPAPEAAVPPAFPAAPPLAPPRPTPVVVPVRGAASAPAVVPGLPPWPGRKRLSLVPAPVPRLAGLRPTAHVLSFGEAPALEIGPLDDSDELIE